MAKRKLFGKYAYYDGSNLLYDDQKKARKYFDMHFYGNDEDKAKAERWFRKDGSTLLADSLREGDYKGAVLQFATSYTKLPNEKTIEDVKKYKRPKYNSKAKDITTSYQQYERARLSAINTDWNHPQKARIINHRYAQLGRAIKNRIDRLSQPQAQATIQAERSMTPPKSEKKAQTSAKAWANGVG